MLYNYLKGSIDFLLIIHLIKYINRDSLKFYYNIFLYNSICIIVHSLLKILVYELFLESQRFYIKWIIYLLWTMPHYYITLIFNSIETHKCITKTYPIKFNKTPILWSKHIVYTGYNQLIIWFFSYQPYILPINYYTYIIYLFILSIVNSFYCHYPYWNYHHISVSSQIQLIDKNLIYHLGYGIAFSIIHYLVQDDILYYHYNAIIYPLSCLNVFWINQEDIKIDKSTSNNNIKTIKHLSLFTLPKYLSRIILYIIIKIINPINNDKY